MSAQWNCLKNVVVDEPLFFHPPNKSVLFTPTYLRPDSSDRRLTFYVRLGGGVVGVVTTTPSHISASNLFPVLLFPTNVTASSDTASCDAPVSLSV